VLTPRAVPWNGALAGTLEADAVAGERRAKVHTVASLTSVGNGVPITGQIDIGYDQHAGTVNFGDSHIATPATSLILSGTLGQNLDIRGRSTNLDEVLPALAMVSDKAPVTLPLKLDAAKRGEAAVAGMVSGPFENLQFCGRVTVTNASVEGHGFDRFSADVQASRQAVALRRAELARARIEIAGDAV